METVQYVQSKLCFVRGICNWATGRNRTNRIAILLLAMHTICEARTKRKEDISAVLWKKNLHLRIYIRCHLDFYHGE